MRTWKKCSLNCVAFATIVRKEMHRILRIWLQTLLAPAFSVGLYLIIFGQCVGSLLPHMHNYSYIQYILPGLMVMAIIQNSYANTAYSFFLAKFTNSIEEMLVAPMSSIIILLGYICGGVIRGLLVGMIIYAIGCLFTVIPIQHPVSLIILATLTAVVFSMAGLINAIYAKDFDGVAFFATFVISPLTYLGGIFYTIDQLSLYWRRIIVLNPIFNIVDDFRFAMLGIINFHVGYGRIVIVALLFILFIWSWYLLNYGINIKK